MAEANIDVCGMCLGVQNIMYNLDQHPLETYYFEILTGTNPLETKIFKKMVCEMCMTLVKKYYQFRKDCIENQSMLENLVLYGEITPKAIEQLRTSRSTAPNIVSTTDNSIDTSQAAKTNYFLGISDSQIVTQSSDIKIELPSELEDADELLENSLKHEDLDNYDASALEPSFDSSDDDEPLAQQKIKKNLIAKVKKKRKPKSVPQDIVTENTDKEAIIADDLDNYITVICLTVKEQLEEVNKRKLTSNYLNSPYQCNLCFKGFVDSAAWKHHVTKHSPNSGDIECSICKFRFKTKRSLQKHTTNHEKKYICKVCPYVSTNMTQAKQHQGWHKGVTYKCKHCGEVFTVWTSYMSHVRIKHPSQFICGVCGYSFISKLGLNMHTTMMHKDYQSNDMKNEEGPYCAECKVKFVSTEAWKRHLVMSTKHTETTKTIKGCRSCGEKFDNTEQLRLHHRREHARPRPKNYGKKPSNMKWPVKCEHCTEEIANGRDYWKHFRRFHPDKKYPIQKDYVCDICGKSFQGNALLVYHRRTHFDERLFKCSQCDKSFFNRTNLLIHERCHSDSRPYSCTVCFKAFKSKGAVDRHFRSHTGQKPYECEVCGKGFSQSNSRKLHVRTVHLKQPAPYVSRNRTERKKQIISTKDINQQHFAVLH